MLVAHLTDFHLDGSGITRARLRRVADELAAATMPVDLIIVTGDIVEGSAFDDAEATLGEYRLAHDILVSLAPVAYCPGNSDGEAFDLFIDEAFPGDGTNRRVEANGVTFLMLDSRIPGDYRGHVPDATVAWLEASLEAAIGPVVIALHHPPVEIGHPMFDRLKLANPHVLEAVLGRFPNVAAIFCGHIHMALATRFAGVPLAIAPGVHSLGSSPWTLQESRSTLIDPGAPPGFTMHRIDASGLTSFPVVLHGNDA